MTFDEVLNSYIQRLDVNARELAAACGLSQAVISRYRSGTRTPASDGQALTALAEGLAALSAQRGLEGASPKKVLADLRQALAEGKDGQRLAVNLNLLISVMQIRQVELARALNFDPSYLSRIRGGRRQPGDMTAFAQGVGGFVARRYAGAQARADLARLLEVSEKTLEDDYACACAVAAWLLDGRAEQPDAMLSFLEKLDEFDLNDYIRAIRFEELKVPSAPFQLPVSKTYYGVEGFRQGALDFIKATVLSPQEQPVFMCSDMPIADMAQDVDFSKKWMYGLALILKKGLRLDMIHDLNRPFNEMMLGLESWIPLYMTGQIVPWYLKGAQNSIYGHLTFCSGAAALEGECVMGAHAKGRCRFSKAGRDKRYCRDRADALLRRALPLMDIYRGKSESAYQAFLLADARESGKRRAILTAPPLHTLPADCLERMLDKAGLDQARRQRVNAAWAQSRAWVENVLERGAYEESYPALSREAFQANPAALPLSELMCDQDILYDYEDYQRHLKHTRAYAQAHPGYTPSGRPGGAS